MLEYKMLTIYCNTIYSLNLDMKQIEDHVRSISMDGLNWGNCMCLYLLNYYLVCCCSVFSKAVSIL